MITFRETGGAFHKPRVNNRFFFQRAPPPPHLVDVHPVEAEQRLVPFVIVERHGGSEVVQHARVLALGGVNLIA